MIRLVPVFVLAAFICSRAVEETAQEPAHGPGNVAIVFRNQQSSYSLDLNLLKPEGDSCAQVRIDFREIAGAWARFVYEQEQGWRFEDIGNHGSPGPGALKVRTIFDQGGNASSWVILVKADADSVPEIANNMVRRHDLPASGDSAVPVPYGFSIERSAWDCAPKDKVKIIVRKFTYPARYMRRDPEGLNYPELAMFHYGYNIHMPTAGSINERGALINYWHILHPDDLEYQNREGK
jgi:hypothetical protein